MQKNYWQFILGLQHNSQLYFDDHLHHYNMHHTWCAVSNNVFLVRDLETNELIYDSIVHLVVDLHEQGIQQCQIIPFNHIFSDLPANFKKFNFETYNYPLAIFSNRHQSLALVKIHSEKVKSFSTSPDPREFSGFPSTQQYCGYSLFTLIKLDQKQQKTLDEFDQPQNWKNYYQELSLDFLDHPFKFKKDLNLTLTNNLFISADSYEYPFLNSASPDLNLAFSLVNKLIDLQDMFENEIYMSMEGRSSDSAYIDRNYSQINNFQNELSDKFIELIAYTANDYQNAYVDQGFNPISKNLLKNKLIENDSNTDIEDVENNEKETMTTFASTLYLIIFLAIAFGLLYGVFWLVSHYEFAKFMIITIGVIIFLAICSKK